MARRMRIGAGYAGLATPNYPEVAFPYYYVPMTIWNGATFRPSRDFMWDTAASCCVVDRAFATRFRFRLDDVNDRLLDAVSGLGGEYDGRLTTRHVQFPLLSRGWLRGRSLRFRFHFMVVDRPMPFPLLGVRDVVANFDVTTTWDAAVFDLRRGREGEPV